MLTARPALIAVTFLACAGEPATPSVESALEGTPAIQITSPLPNATISTVSAQIQTAASPAVTRVEFFEDFVSLGVDTSAPFEWTWAPFINHLPPLPHPIDLGYYFVEWKNPATFDAYRAEVNGYTNTYYALLSGYVADFPDQWPALLNESLADAVRENKKIHLQLELHHDHLQPYLDMMLNVAAPYWGNVARIELADEVTWDRAETESWIAVVNQKLAARNLPAPPQGLGVGTWYGAPLTTAVQATGLSWVGVECYVDPPGDPNTVLNVRWMHNNVRSQIASVPPGKQIVLIGMAYDRNGNWTNMDTLRDLQTPTYLIAATEPRVLAINWFAYARPGGTRAHPELKPSHRFIGQRAQPTPMRLGGSGRHTLIARGYAADGTFADHVVNVNVQGTSASP
jgi:hypothetical protein